MISQGWGEESWADTQTSRNTLALLTFEYLNRLEKLA